MIGAGRSTSAPFMIFRMGCVVRIGLNIVYLNGRIGPFDRVVNFTIITIVNSKINVIIISINMFCAEYMFVSCSLFI